MWSDAQWITASAAAAPLASVSGCSRSPRWASTPAASSCRAPSADVLDRIAKGLMLTEPEPEHLYILGLGRPPEARQQPVDGITPRLQRMLDGMPLGPAIIKTAMWDVVG